MENLALYEKYRSVPENAQKKIGGGRLKGMTDINPMWRIKSLTEAFGACGFGWKVEIARQWVESGANGESAAYCNINLYVKQDGEWSSAIPGTGGAMFTASEKGGIYTDDEAFKKALTDAISVACKCLGFGADIYWQADRTKYTERPTSQSTSPKGEELIEAGKLRLEIDQLATELGFDTEYLDRLAVKNCGCEYDALNKGQLAGLLQFLRGKKK